MDTDPADQLKLDATEDRFENYASAVAGDAIDRDSPPMHGHHSTSTREFEHRGRSIVITTTYEVTVDGQPLTGHLGVDRDGTVHYHGMPQMSFDSAVDMVKRVVDIIDAQGSGAAGGH